MRKGIFIYFFSNKHETPLVYVTCTIIKQGDCVIINVLSFLQKKMQRASSVR